MPVSGKLLDPDLFGEVIHSPATRQEFIDKENANRQAYEVYVLNAQGGEVLLTDETLDAQAFVTSPKASCALAKTAFYQPTSPTLLRST